MTTAALKTRTEIASTPPRWIPSNPQWATYVRAWTFMPNPTLLRALLNSTIITVSHTLLLLLACSLTGYVLAKYKFRGERLIFMWIVSQMMIPGFTGLIPMYLLMVWFGWINTYWALIIPGAFSAYSIFLMRQYIITIPNEILDAARLYGCSEFGLFWRMILPLSKPALSAIGLINFVWIWNDLLWPMLMIKNREWYTIQVALNGLFELRTSFDYMSVVAASITIATLPLVIFTIVTQKYLIKGFTGLSYTKR